MSIDRGMDKDVVHIQLNITQPGKKKMKPSFAEMWMGLESVIHSEVSQKEKNKHYILTHIGGI